MGYFNAENVLPAELISKIQEYVSGEFVYIPCREGCQKAWGEKSGARRSIRERNRQIYKAYCQGKTVDELSGVYYLSEYSIRRIICNEKRKARRGGNDHD